MKRTQRIVLTALAAAASVAVVLGLVVLGSASRGPLSALFGRIGTGVSGVESGIVRTFRGPGRSAELAWLGELRRHPDSLRHPDTLLLGVYEMVSR